MGDAVEQLRAIPPTGFRHTGDWHLLQDAADEIERLRTAIYNASRTTPGHAKNILAAALAHNPSAPNQLEQGEG